MTTATCTTQITCCNCGHAIPTTPSFEYTGSQVVVSLATESGPLRYTMTSAEFVASIDAAVALVNENMAEFFADVPLFDAR